jgi:hypothetical protein
MMNLQTPNGEPIFHTISITLVCDACLKTEHPGTNSSIQTMQNLRFPKPVTVQALFTCSSRALQTQDGIAAAMDLQQQGRDCHYVACRLPRIPYQTVTRRGRTHSRPTADDPAMILRETLGLSADGSTKAYRLDDVDSFFNRPPGALMWNNRRPEDCIYNFFVAVLFSFHPPHPLHMFVLWLRFAFLRAGGPLRRRSEWVRNKQLVSPLHRSDPGASLFHRRSCS